MRDAAADLEFEEAARLRDEIKRLEALELEVPVGAAGPVAAGTGGRGSVSAARARGKTAIEQIAQGYAASKARGNGKDRGGRMNAKMKSGRPRGGRY